MLLIIFVLAFVEFNFRPNNKEKIIINLINLHYQIERGRVQFEDMGDELNKHIYYFNEIREGLSYSLSSQEKKLLPKKIKEINMDCLN